MERRMNCWEFNKCGRQEGGEHVHDLGICPSAIETRLDGIHNGMNAGRACWVVSGTLCKGTVQGTFAQKFKSCIACDFYRHVRKAEHPDFKLTPVLLNKLDDSL